MNAEVWAEMQVMAERAAAAGIALKVPPPIFVEMDGRFEYYEKRKRLHASFYAAERYANPVGIMQGGVISAAIDNTVGPLSYLAAMKPSTTLDLNVNYVRAVKIGERMFVHAYVVARGRQTMYMEAEAFDKNEKLLARATTQVLIISAPGSAG